MTSPIGQHNGHVLGLIADRRIKAGEWKDLHRGLIAQALREAGL